MYWPSMLVLAVILYATFSSDPMGADELPAIPHIDKAIHAIMMGGFVGAIAFDTQRADKNRKILTLRFMLWVAMGVIAFSVVDELMQGMLDNGRGTELGDFIADCVGALAAMLLAPPAIRKVLKI